MPGWTEERLWQNFEKQMKTVNWLEKLDEDTLRIFWEQMHYKIYWQLTKTLGEEQDQEKREIYKWTSWSNSILEWKPRSNSSAWHIRMTMNSLLWYYWLLFKWATISFGLSTFPSATKAICTLYLLPRYFCLYIQCWIVHLLFCCPHLVFSFSREITPTVNCLLPNLLRALYFTLSFCPLNCTPMNVYQYPWTVYLCNFNIL